MELVYEKKQNWGRDTNNKNINIYKKLWETWKTVNPTIFTEFGPLELLSTNPYHKVGLITSSKWSYKP